MDSPEKIETLARSTARTMGLGRDTIASLHTLANGLDKRTLRLEDVLESLGAAGELEGKRFLELRRRLGEGPFLD